MLDLKSIMIGVLLGIALVFILGAPHKKGKIKLYLLGMSRFMQFPTVTARQ